jgi:hypothetical protein
MHIMLQCVSILMRLSVIAAISTLARVCKPGGGHNNLRACVSTKCLGGHCLRDSFCVHPRWEVSSSSSSVCMHAHTLIYSLLFTLHYIHTTITSRLRKHIHHFCACGLVLVRTFEPPCHYDQLKLQSIVTKYVHVGLSVGETCV